MKFVLFNDLCVFHANDYKELRAIFGPLTYYRDSFPGHPYSKWIKDVVGVNFSRRDAEEYLDQVDDINIERVLEIKANYFIGLVDAQDLEHEFVHYEYWKDPTKANSYWNGMSPRQQEKWYNKLHKQGYNNRVMIDEIYAYVKT